MGIGAIDPVAGEVSIICENPDFNQKGRQHIFNLAVALVGASGQVSVKSGKQQCRLGYCDGQGGVTPVFIPAVLKIMSFAPGDANNSGALNGVDVIYLINYLRGKGPEIAGQILGDADGNCQVNGLDIIYLIRYFEGRGPAPILGGCR